MSKNKLLKRIKKAKAISAQDAAEILGGRQKVYRMAERGELIHVYPEGIGFFTLPEIEEGEAQFAIVASYYPKCVISGTTALSLYGLSDDYIREIDVDIPRTTNLSNPLLRVHRVNPNKIIGVTQRSFENKGVPFKVKIYSPERALHEAYKYYHLTDSFYRALKRYRNMYLDTTSPGKQYEEILSINKKVGEIIVNFLKMGDVDE